MAGQKRTRSGQLKAQGENQEAQTQDVTMTNTPPCGQAQPSSSKTAPSKSPKAKDTKTEDEAETPQEKKPRAKAKPSNTYCPNRVKRPRLPDNATISKRPLLHPAIPTPFSSSASPKVLYITASSPFIPTCKRIRSLLTAIGKREAQSAAEGSKRGKRGKALEANGRLEAKDVEASIASGANLKGKKSKDIGSEEVYLKATGRAIPRALELGVKFQGEDDCRVRVEMGSVKAIDDLEVKSGSESAQAEGEEPREEEEVPETRIRTLSTVTVCIGLK